MKQEHLAKVTDEQIIECYEEKMTLHQTASKLNMTTVTLWRRAKKMNIFWSKIPRNPTNKIPLIEILNGLHPYYQTFKLKKRLLEEKVKKNNCEVCGINEWNNKPISLQLDHIDGNSHNHILSNLRLICPNCHSQTDTYCGKNR
jgi:hypothetical protein